MSLNSHRLLLLFPHTTRNWYLDATSGNDNNTGRSYGSAFKTISKINSLPLVAGDNVFLKRGEIWREMLAPPDHGDGIVNFKAYGDNATNPIISGSSLTHSLNLETPNYTFSDIKFNGSTGTGNQVALVLNHDNYFYRCEFYSSGSSYGFSGYSVDGALLYNIQLFDCIAHDNYRSGLSIGSETGQYGSKNCLIQNCVSYNNGHADTDHGVYVDFGTTVRKTTCYNNIYGAGVKVNCNSVTTSTFYPIIDSCLSYGNYFGYYIGHFHAVLQNSIAYINLHNNVYLDADAKQTNIYNNTFVNSAAEGMLWDSDVTNANNILKNNIVLQDFSVVGAKIPVDMVSSAHLALYNTFNNNCYYYNGNAATAIIGSRTFAAWKALTGSPDAQGILGEPAFTTKYTDFHLQASSPCKTAGANLGIQIDYDNVSRSITPSIGAYEFL
jgi:hypothetical protein